MSEFFLHLRREEQSQIYRALAPRLARMPVVTWTSPSTIEDWMEPSTHLPKGSHAVG